MKKYHGGEDGVEGLERGLRDVDQRRVPSHPRFLPDRPRRVRIEVSRRARIQVPKRARISEEGSDLRLIDICITQL